MIKEPEAAALYTLHVLEDKALDVCLDHSLNRVHCSDSKLDW